MATRDSLPLAGGRLRLRSGSSAEAWLRTARRGRCADAPASPWPSCAHDSSLAGGVFVLSDRDAKDFPSAFRTCAARCAACERCRHLSISLAARECAWAAACALDESRGDFRSAALPRPFLHSFPHSSLQSSSSVHSFAHSSLQSSSSVYSFAHTSLQSSSSVHSFPHSSLHSSSSPAASPHPSAHLHAAPPSLPRCAALLLAKCTLRHAPASNSTAAALPLARVYVLHYTCARARRRLQQSQLPRLGLPLTWVERCDRLSPADEQCALRPSAAPRHASAKPFLPPVLKLYTALRDMLSRGIEAALILEDDAKINFQALDSVGHALRRLALASALMGNWTLLSLGSYNAAGTDNGLPAGLHRSHAAVPGARRGGVMPAIAQAISLAGARHILAHAFPIEANIDILLSDEALSTASPGTTWYLKGLPGYNWTYAVTPAGSSLGTERSTASPSAGCRK
ncbi:hypothetical protein AB1Y20_013360 [Prymnesium parvum]|uniref:Uncharacterized protein n=1 Tax=Prymnesium parvum TaxID=97485 RepID=A0AB34IMM3_PRYPA